MAAFLEERLPTTIDWGGSFSENHSVQTITTIGGNEYRSLRHPYVQLSYDIAYKRDIGFVRQKILDLYTRANGMFRGFRVKDTKDFSSNNYDQAPTAFDQPMLLVSGTTYQLMRWYGNPADTMCARRRIRKPVSGTALIGVGGTVYPPTMYSVDYTTGLVPLNANKTGAITGITKGSTTVITVANSMEIGESVLINGCAGMTQINGLRANITARTAGTITVAINSTAFSNYTSGGTVNTAPQSGEAVTAGFLFDIPCRFDTDLSGAFSDWGTIDATGIQILELLNP